MEQWDINEIGQASHMCTTWKKQIQYEIKPLMVWLIIKVIIKDLWLDDKLEKQ